MSVDAGQDSAQSEPQHAGPRTSLDTAAARNLATTTKSAPQMQGISSRWLLKVLPWVQVNAGTYRVNRRLSYAVGDGRVTFVKTGSEVRVIPQELGEIAALRSFDDESALTALADRFVQREYEVGQVIARAGDSADTVYLVAHGKIEKLGEGLYGEPTRLGVLADGDHFGEQALLTDDDTWQYTAKAVTATTVLALPRSALTSLLGVSDGLREHLEAVRSLPRQRANKRGEADIELASGHKGEPSLPATYADYEAKPREYELSVAQTVLRVHSRVADLYNEPMNQTEEQLKLTVEALRERQEHELINNPEFGLLNNAEYEQRIQPHAGPPLPDDLDELISRRRGTRYLLAHPKTIAAIGREWTRAGIYPDSVEVLGANVPAWRGVPILSCNKIPISAERTSSVIAIRTGEDNQGVIGLNQTGLPDEYEPGLNVRFMGIDDKAVISYLVSTYFSAAVLVPDALGVLENVHVSNWR
ncbi:family 2B encapsulin nanocompartment shell protein [Actinacidiphila sp. DG2A-62]|jgi:CRP-like cAMP-binding protein|uniref:family 2B encapsulin nanocompartment shell protein n=1 Tax=Actinacidiphila sp. DG2A-62 TaxID=3108821 RepID=UPI002DBC5B53|nr:family 2B encapsulin nanocompartment shell protein [Actinacidiphila sp. DG2A-62]MEC3993947.1 family 2B encapsulin nanocompartment shell protein [Actinacidiphila sp. DG2A-62]